MTNHADKATIWRESTARRKRSQAWRERRRYAHAHTRQPQEPVSHACPGPFGQRRGPGRNDHTPREAPPRPALWRHGAGGSGAPPFMEPVGHGAPPSPPPPFEASRRSSAFSSAPKSRTAAEKYRYRSSEIAVPRPP